MKKNILILILFFAVLTSFAQELSTKDKKALKLFDDAQTSFTYNELEGAVQLLTMAIDRDPMFIEAYIFLGEVLTKMKKYQEAIDAFEKSIALRPNYINQVYFALGTLYQDFGNYDKSKENFSIFLKTGTENPEFERLAKVGLATADFAKEALKNPFVINPINMGEEVNTVYPEYFPSITGDDQTFLYTRQLDSRETPTGHNEDFYITTRENDKWTTAKNLGRPINTLHNEGAPCLSPDGQLLIFTACEIMGDYGEGRRGYGSCDLFLSQKNGSRWSTPVNLGPAINTKFWESQPSFASDGRTLYFVRGVRQRDGRRKTDIYSAKVNTDGTWETPQPLSNVINSPGNEESVFIHPDGQTLYFASDGHVGLGGTDIFMSRKQKDGNWGTPINLGSPINTAENENSFLVTADGKYAFYSSEKAGGFGQLDLYQIELPEPFKPVMTSFFKGKVFDAITKAPLSARFELIDLETGETVVSSVSNNGNGEFIVNLPGGKNYALNASKKGYMFYSENFSSEFVQPGKTMVKDVPMNPIKTGEKVVLKNIFFETGKFDLKPESKVELEKLLRFLSDNPIVSIEIAGHTDNQGNEASNKVLSQNRAKSVLDYLTNAGVAAIRLTSAGYGSTKPIADNATEEGRSQNRRTEFIITAQ